MPKNKTFPTNNIDTLGFSSHHWGIFARAAEIQQTPYRIIIPICATPLSADGAKLVSEKIDAYLALVHTYYPKHPIEFIYGDKLSFDNHQEPGSEKAAQDMKTTREQLAAQLKIPLNLLAEQNTLDFQYVPRHQFEGVQSPANKTVQLSSWSSVQSELVLKFMAEIRQVLQKIGTSAAPESVLLDDELLFSETYLGFAKTFIEKKVTDEIGYNKRSTDQFTQLMSSFTLSAIHHLKKVHKATPILCKTNANNQKKTEVKNEIFKCLPKETRVRDFIASLTYLLEEFCVFQEMLVQFPRAQGVPDQSLVQILYPGKSTAPAFHPLYQLDYFLSSMKLDSRRFLACAEFENKERFTSSNGDNTMLKKLSNPSVSPPIQIKTISSALEAHNGSLGQSTVHPEDELPAVLNSPPSSKSSDNGQQNEDDQRLQFGDGELSDDEKEELLLGGLRKAAMQTINPKNADLVCAKVLSFLMATEKPKSKAAQPTSKPLRLSQTQEQKEQPANAAQNNAAKQNLSLASNNG